MRVGDPSNDGGVLALCVCNPGDNGGMLSFRVGQPLGNRRSKPGMGRVGDGLSDRGVDSLRIQICLSDSACSCHCRIQHFRHNTRRRGCGTGRCDCGNRCRRRYNGWGCGDTGGEGEQLAVAVVSAVVVRVTVVATVARGADVADASFP